MVFKRILFVTANPRMLGLARLPEAFHRAGIQPAVLCPPGSHVEHSRYVERVFHFRLRLNGWPLLPLLRAVWTWAPDLLLPGDDRTAQWLAALATERLGGRLPIAPAGLRQLVRTSLGAPVEYPVLGNKQRFQSRARDLGVRTPDDRAVSSLEDARRHAEALGYPVVLKSAYGMGGRGVWRCDMPQELDAACAAVGHDSEPGGWRSVSTVRTGLHRLMGLPEPIGSGPTSVQRFVTGTPVMHTFSAWEGRVLAGLTGVKEQVHPAPFGPSSVLHVVRHAEIESAAVRLARHFGLSGIASFDFVMDAEGASYLLECNPRPTPISHLGPSFGADLVGPLRCAVEGESTGEAVYGKEGWVSLFPQEFLRDPDSAFLDRVPLDIPVADDPLLKHLLHRALDADQRQRWQKRARTMRSALSPNGTA